MASKTTKPVAKVAAPPKPAPVVEKPPVVEMEDFNFGGYVAQAPKGSVPLYSESHPIEGLTKVVFQVENAPVDGRVGGTKKHYVWRK